MIGFKIDQAKGLFFDTDKVKQQIGKQKRRALAIFGFRVRRAARRSLRRRKRASNPGQAPSNRLGLVKRFLFFVADFERDNVLIGPAKLSTATPDALEMLEHGGNTQRKNKAGKTVRAHYEARPFMEPAFTRELDGAAELFKDAGF